MEEITGKITDKNIKEGISGSGRPWTKYTFVVNGKNYATFDQVKGQEFKVGDNVKMRGEQEGKYWTLKELEHIDEVFVASERVETPQAEKVVTQALRTSRHFAELDTKDVFDTATRLYLADDNIDGLKFPEIIDMVTEEFIKTSKRLEEELSS
jgi:hypothetical protein